MGCRWFEWAAAALLALLLTATPLYAPCFSCSTSLNCPEQGKFIKYYCNGSQGIIPCCGDSCTLVMPYCGGGTARCRFFNHCYGEMYVNEDCCASCGYRCQ